MKFTIEPTKGKALDPRMVKGSDDLSLNSPFFNLKFVKENPCERAGVVLRIEDQARDMLEKEVRFSLDVDAPNYRAVTGFENGLGVQVMCGGMATYSDINKQLFEVFVLESTNKSNTRFNYLDGANFTQTQTGEFMTAQEVSELMERVRAHKR